MTAIGKHMTIEHIKYVRPKGERKQNYSFALIVSPNIRLAQDRSHLFSTLLTALWRINLLLIFLMSLLKKKIHKKNLFVYNTSICCLGTMAKENEDGHNEPTIHNGENIHFFFPVIDASSLRKESKKTHLMICGNLEERGKEELKQLRKFWAITSIEEAIGPSGCFIHRCKKSVAYQIVKLTDRHAKNIIDGKHVLSTAIPIDSFKDIKAAIFHQTLKIAFECIKLDVPLFLISPNDCHVYYIWLDADETLSFECPARRNVTLKTKSNGFVCKCRNEEKPGFCNYFDNDPEFKDNIVSLLKELSDVTNQLCFPVFELSAFINFCIAEHHHLDRIIDKNQSEFNEIFSNAVTKVSAKDIIGKLPNDVLKKMISG